MHILQEISDPCGHVYGQSFDVDHVIDARMLLIGDELVALKVARQAPLNDQVRLHYGHDNGGNHGDCKPTYREWLALGLRATQ